MSATTLDNRIAEIVKTLDGSITGSSITDEFWLVEHEAVAILRRALIEQDRLTRHACAEAVLAIAAIPETETNLGARIVLKAMCQDASQACLKAQALD